MAAGKNLVASGYKPPPRRSKQPHSTANHSVGFGQYLNFEIRRSPLRGIPFRHVVEMEIVAGSRFIDAGDSTSGLDLWRRCDALGS